MIRQNRAVPILLALTFTFILYLAGCFGAEEPITAETEVPTPVVEAPTSPPVVTDEIDPDVEPEEPFFHTVEDGDRLGSIASKYNVTTDVILRANPDLNPNVLIIGERIRVPGARTDNTLLGDPAEDRADGESSDYAIEEGDSLLAIAQTYQVSLEALIEANPEIDPDNLQINQLLTIPPRGTGLPAAELEASSTPVPVEREPGEVLVHPVAAGDILSAIAETYGVSVEAILEVNGIANPDEITVGLELLIPPPDRPADG